MTVCLFSWLLFYRNLNWLSTVNALTCLCLRMHMMMTTRSKMKTTTPLLMATQTQMSTGTFSVKQYIDNISLTHRASHESLSPFFIFLTNFQWKFYKCQLLLFIPEFTSPFAIVLHPYREEQICRLWSRSEKGMSRARPTRPIDLRGDGMRS